MHSRIFHITSDPEASPVTELDLPEWFVGEIADYVDVIHSDSLFSGSVNYLAVLLGIEIKDNKFTVTDTSFDEYFNKKWWAFKNAIDNLHKTMTFEIFKGKSGVGIDSFDYQMWCINRICSDKYGYYVCDDDGYPFPLDDWLRNYAKPNTTYYIKAVIDYHF